MQDQQSKEAADKKPLAVRMPGFISDDQIGLGDVIKKITWRMGIQPCDSCGRRAAYLNSKIVFTAKPNSKK